TKGIHIIYQDQFAPYALLIPTRNDRRVFFVIPWLGYSLIGTTDTDFFGDPDKVDVEKEDIDYLFQEMKRIFPKKELRKDKIVSTFAGLRPLVFEKGAPSKVSRQHTVEEPASGVVYVVGGKYTTYRKIAEDTLKKITSKKLVNTEEEYPLYGGGIITEEEMRGDASKYNLTRETIQYLVDVYGTKYRDVLALANQNKELLKPLCSCSLAIEAQVIYALKTEMACSEEDILYRRLSLGYFPCSTGRCRDAIRRIMKENN
ncbi:MAG: FAD-dependent oxidoreductase, partial [Planctomycetes bacterium]|nr:FAD-dependent oxidoreductase [Planctomycetota bacterium]